METGFLFFKFCSKSFVLYYYYSIIYIVITYKIMITSELRHGNFIFFVELKKKMYNCRIFLLARWWKIEES